MRWLYLFIAIVTEVIAANALKASEGFTKWVPLVIVAVGYGTSLFFFSLTLKTIPLGIAYAIWSGVGIVLIALIGWLYFHQKLDMPAIVGMALIVAGVVVINLLSKTVQE